MSLKKFNNFINDASIAIYHIFVNKSVATILPGVIIIRLSNDYKISLLLKASDDSAVAFRILANLLLFLQNILSSCWRTSELVQHRWTSDAD